MAGYGGPDDHIEAQQNHVDDSLALVRMLAGPTDNRFTVCLECGDEIPEKRRQALPGCRYCFPCQSASESAKRSVAQFRLRNTYVP